jgi:hypothetical protein
MRRATRSHRLWTCVRWKGTSRRDITEILSSEVQQINQALLDYFQMNVFTPGILPFVNADVVENWLGQHPEPVIVKSLLREHNLRVQKENGFE